MNIKQFSAVEHPYNLPNFGNVLSWSLPFVAEKCADFVTALHKLELEEEEAELEAQEEKLVRETNSKALDEIAQRREIIRNKVLAMGKMQMMFATLRREKENIIKLKGLTGDNMLPKGVLLQGPNAIQASVDFFERSKEKHREDEMMPIEKYESELRHSGNKQAKRTLENLRKSHENLSQFVVKK
jgi:serine/threonine-protein phosphatase 2B catalytic subunit